MYTRATPLTSLDTFREITQYHPWHFWGLAGPPPSPAAVAAQGRENGCRPIIRQYGWQAGDAVSREQIAQALVDAEELVRTELEYPIAPQFRTATLTVPSYYNPTLVQPRPIGSDGRWQSVELPDGELIAVGIETVTLLATPAYDGPFPYAPGANSVGTLAYYDRDGDGLVDQAQIRLTDSTTPLDEFALYVPPPSGAGGNGRFDESARSDRWRIHPIIATRSGDTVTIQVPAWLLVEPILSEGAQAGSLNGINPQSSASYLQSVEVCRRFCDPTGTSVATAQAMLIWESGPWPWCCATTGSSATDPAAQAYAIARVAIRNARIGRVAPAEAVYDAATGTWHACDCATWWGCRPPDRVEVRYLAGQRLTRGQVAAPWDRLIVGMAAAMLARPLQGCKDTASLINFWQTDPTRAAGNETFQAQPRANNPFGTRRGQIDAWAQVQSDRLIRGIQP